MLCYALRSKSSLVSKALIYYLYLSWYIRYITNTTCNINTTNRGNSRLFILFSTKNVNV